MTTVVEGGPPGGKSSARTIPPPYAEWDFAAGDGLSNAQKYMLATNPNDLHLGFTAGLEWNGNRRTVVWKPDLANGNYRIMGRKALDDGGQWESVTDIPDLANSDYRFFRVHAVAP